VAWYLDNCVSEERDHVPEVTACWCLSTGMHNVTAQDTRTEHEKYILVSHSVRMPFHILRRRTCVIGVCEWITFRL